MSGPIGSNGGHQPWLHQLSVCVNGNTTALSDSSGELDDASAHGLFVDDRRLVSVLTLRVGQHVTSPVASASVGCQAEFLGSARHLGDEGPDPTVEVKRRRVLGESLMTEEITVVSRASETLRTDLEVSVGGDGASIAAIKSGSSPAELLPVVAAAGTLQWRDEWHLTTVSADPAPSQLRTGAAGIPATLTFSLTVPSGGSTCVSVVVTANRLRPSNFDAGPGVAQIRWQDVAVEAEDPRLKPTVETAIEDLRHLLMTDPEAPQDVFAAAGSPWYLTLFGRDALWTGRMMLPFGTKLALGTLRALARRQGKRHDPSRAESPGKIPHELRRTAYIDPISGLSLPPVYYGTIDATPLWIILLHDAWRWGTPDADVEQLAPALKAAVGWLTEGAAPEVDGLLRYLDETGTGLVNQGWKDSGDAIRWRDGRIAQAPIALVEAQAYAVEAAQAAAALYEAIGIEGAASLTAWAQAMRARVRERFWVGGDDPYLALAIDGSGEAVDGVASNMGHVLGTSTLSAHESALVVQRLSSSTMLGRYGVATLATDNGGYNPIGYHTGSIWTHDTAIAALGMAREGRQLEALQAAESLLASAAAFNYRWPELYSGEAVLGRPAPYPASCRPQAWSAASAAALVSVALGFQPDAPSRRLTLRPSRPAAYGAMEVSGLRFAGHPFTVRCAHDGTTDVSDLPSDVEVLIK